MRKISIFFILCTMVFSLHAERVTPVWSGEYSFPENDGWQEVSSEKLTNLKLGDYLMVTVSEITNPDGWAQITLAGRSPWTTIPGANWNDIKVGKTLYQINDATLLASIKDGGLGVQGKYYTLTDISIVDASNLKSIWSGEYSFPENDGWQEVAADKFANLKLGDYLLITVSGITNPDGWAQITMAGKDPWTIVPGADWNDVRVGQSLYVINDEDLLASIKSGGLGVQGKYYTLTDISIPNGSWDAWLGEKVFDGNWGTNLEIAKEEFAKMEVGYRLELSINSMTEGQCVNVQAGDWTDFPHKEQYIFTEDDETAGNKVIEFELSPVDVEIIKDKGLIVKGTSFTLTGVKVVPNVPSLTNMKHDLSISEAGMATIMLPYYVPALPEGMKAYTLTMVGDYISASEVTTIMPDEAVLIVAEQGDYTLVSAENVSDALSGKEASYTNGALVGMYQKGTVPNSSSPTYNYVLQNGAEGVGFYQVQSDDIAINPYRAYLTCGYNSQATPGTAPLRIIFHESGTTAIKNAATDNHPNKVVRNGRLYIQHDNQLYTIHGQKIQ